MKRTKLKEPETDDAKCAYAAPYICFQAKPSNAWHLIQSCCNHWDCPRCGQIRAREEYGRIVEGAKKLTGEGRQLFFWTFTCRGKELTRAEAEAGYLTWTHRLLDSAAHKASRAGEYWCYMQVTERQKRGHPHSHMLTTFLPPDAFPFSKDDILPNHRRAKHDCIWSAWYREANIRAGLGIECDISAVQSAEAVARYVGKYLFKQTAQDRWPPGWKRVRYSQNWPDLPDVSNPTAFPVIRRSDWREVRALDVPVRADSRLTFQIANAHGAFNVMPPKPGVRH